MANCTTEPESGFNSGWDGPNIPSAIIVSIGAGLATSLGGALVFFPDFLKRVPQTTILGISLALSAGVMMYVSFIEIFAKALDKISADCSFSYGSAVALTTVMFFAGMLACVLLELLVHKIAHKEDAHLGCPAHADPSDVRSWSSSTKDVVETGASQREVEMAAGGKVKATGGKEKATGDGEGATREIAAREVLSDERLEGRDAVEVAITVAEGGVILDALEKKSLSRLGLMTAAAIALHNFPEGLATFLATVTDVGSGASLGVAIAIHNIPEGLCVAMPIYYATGNKWKAFLWSVLSGVTEPIGGIVGFAVLQPVFTDVVYGMVFSLVGGMMIFIVCHELMPAAHRYLNNGNRTTAWLIAGMVIMAASLVIFAL
ncbi:hypothetical protein AB1Y20_016150 [Prymnesium parvum]|uniref:Zinc transporter n=1 Tax=Prymnesium parvum TaxID=97485 RepID=A0AB34K3G0_PRYPA